MERESLLSARYDRAEKTLRECVAHIGRGCRSSSTHDSVGYETNIDNRLAEMRAVVDALEKISATLQEWRYGSDWLGERSGPMPDRVAILRLEEILGIHGVRITNDEILIIEGGIERRAEPGGSA